MNLISVIMPVHNRELVIKKSISSVLDQTYSHFELIIVDDCSTDKTYCEILEIKDPRVQVYKLIKNSGAAAARNYGIKKCKGAIISFLDSDDFFEPEFLERSYNKLSGTGPEIGFMWTGVCYHYNNKKTKFNWVPKRKEDAYQTFLHNLQIGTGAGISIKKEVFKTCGLFNERLPAAEDTEFFLRITRKFDYTYIPDILINIVKETGDRMSRNFCNLALAYNTFIEQHIEEIEKKSDLKRKYFYKMMWLNYNIGEKDLARFYFKKIPSCNIAFLLKAFLVLTMYETLTVKSAKYIHERIS